MSALHILYPVLAVLPVVINGYAMRRDPRHGDAFGLSLMILSIWFGQMVLSTILPIPERSGMNAMFDFTAALAILGCWITVRAPWLLVLLSLFVTQIYLAAAFWWGWSVFDKAIGYGDYVRSNNVLWLLELVVVSFGGASGVVRRFIDDMRHRADDRRAVGAAP